MKNILMLALLVFLYSCKKEEDPHAGHDIYYTCSMHPQIQLPAPGQCPICFMDLIPLEHDAGAAGGLRRLSMSAEARALAGIRSVPVERRVVEAEVLIEVTAKVKTFMVTAVTAMSPTAPKPRSKTPSPSCCANA